MSTIRANTIQDASGGSNAVLLGVASPPNSMGFRNRIINGDMRIDQRNAGAVSSGYSVDRWACFNNITAKATLQKSTVAPAGFAASLLITSTSAYTVAAGEVAGASQSIEGFNVADLAWGTVSASSATLSFWVRSSLTGQFGGAVRNSNGTQSYPFAFTVNAANTFECKTVTISGPTSGTWATDNTTGIAIVFSAGAGSSLKGTAGVWSTASLADATGSNSLVGTSGATFYITGVQLEAGTVATPFERRPYGAELALCQRYYWKNTSGHITSAWGSLYTTTGGRVWRSFPVPMRADPSLSVNTNVFDLIGYGSVTGTVANVITESTAVSFDGIGLSLSGFAGQPFTYSRSFEVSAEL